MDRVQFGPVKGLRIAIAAFTLSLILLLAVLGFGAYLVATQSQNTANFSAELREGLVNNCLTNGNPLRVVLIEEQEAAIQNPRDPRIHKLFPDAPIALAEQVIREGNREHRERIKKLQPVACRSAYPPKP